MEPYALTMCKRKGITMKRIACLLLAAALLFAGCARPQAAGKVMSLTKGIIPAKNISADTEPDASALNAFSAALLQRVLANGEPNPVLSPVSAYLCLAMVQNGAAHDTLKEFEQVLGLDTDALNALSHALIARLSDAQGGTTLNIADSAWVDDDRAEIRESYLKAIADYYGAEVFSADLPSNEALAAINAWINDRTNGLIPKLHEENYPEDSALVLINTLYLKAKWARAFSAFSTGDVAFTKADGTTVTVPFLRDAENPRDYISLDGVEGILLPYDDGKTAFVALRPGSGDARAFAAGLTAERLAAYIAAAAERSVDFAMPKFTIEYMYTLNDALKQMGLNLVFDEGAADLSNMGTGAGKTEPLYLSSVLQKVKILVDEDGTEAAAVTEAIIAARGALIPDVTLHLDSPFVYAVVDLSTGAPLFIGVLDDPS